jgi:hypothetical protein
MNPNLILQDTIRTPTVFAFRHKRGLVATQVESREVWRRRQFSVGSHFIQRACQTFFKLLLGEANRSDVSFWI